MGKSGDIVTMRLNISSSLLEFTINDKKDQIVKIHDIKTAENIQYRMAVYLCVSGDSVELLEYANLHCGDNDDEKQDKTGDPKGVVEDTKTKISQYEEMIDKLQNELLTKINEIDALKNELKEKDTKIQSMQNESQNQIKLLQNKLDEKTQANLRQRSTVLELQH